MSKEHITRVAQALRDAADHEEWERAALLTQELDNYARVSVFDARDKALLTSTLRLLGEAVQSTIRRKEEIRGLVNKLSETPI